MEWPTQVSTSAGCSQAGDLMRRKEAPPDAAAAAPERQAVRVQA